MENHYYVKNYGKITITYKHNIYRSTFHNSFKLLYDESLLSMVS